MSNHPHRNTERVTVTDLRGEHTRVTLPQPFYEPSRGREISPGTILTGLYYGPRTGRMFSRVESIWDRGDGRTVGTIYTELDRDAFVRLCDRVGAPVPDAIPAPLVE